MNGPFAKLDFPGPQKIETQEKQHNKNKIMASHWLCRCFDPSRLFPGRRKQESPLDWQEEDQLLGNLVDIEDDVSILSDKQIRDSVS